MLDCEPPQSRQREDEQRAAGVRHVEVITERADTPRPGLRVFRADAQGEAEAGPAADPREDGNVLLALRPSVRHRVTDNARRALEAPQFPAGALVHRLEPALHRAVENDATGRGERAAVGGQVLLDLPSLFPGGGVPRDEGAPVATRARVHAYDRADVRLPGGVLHLQALVVHA